MLTFSLGQSGCPADLHVPLLFCMCDHKLSLGPAPGDTWGMRVQLLQHLFPRKNMGFPEWRQPRGPSGLTVGRAEIVPSNPSSLGGGEACLIDTLTAGITHSENALGRSHPHLVSGHEGNIIQFCFSLEQMRVEGQEQLA